MKLVKSLARQGYVGSLREMRDTPALRFNSLLQPGIGAFREIRGLCTFWASLTRVCSDSNWIGSHSVTQSLQSKLRTVDLVFGHAAWEPVGMITPTSSKISKERRSLLSEQEKCSRGALYTTPLRTACATCRRYVTPSNRNSRSGSPVSNGSLHSFNRLRRPYCHDRTDRLDRRVAPDYLLHGRRSLSGSRARPGPVSQRS